jgi:hypothetical protein
VRAEDDDRALGDFFNLFDKHDATILERPDNVLIVDDRMANVKRRAMHFESQVDNLNGVGHPGTKAPGRGQEYLVHVARIPS